MCFLPNLNLPCISRQKNKTRQHELVTERVMRNVGDTIGNEFPKEVRYAAEQSVFIQNKCLLIICDV